jgi:hypothetical protein
MPEHPNFASVTTARCGCGYLRDAANDPDKPIVFDKRVGEYHFKYRDGDGDARLVIYHCPFCGGAAPKSKRPSLFHVVSAREQQRLERLLDGISTVGAALKRLGKPDHDNARGFRKQVRRNSRRPLTWRWYRTVQYANLSRVAEVWFVADAQGRTSWYLQGKPKKVARSGRA